MSLSPIAQHVMLHTEASQRAAAELRRADLSEIRTLKQPPKGVSEVLRATLSILYHTTFDSDWTETKKAVTEPKFIDRLREFDPSTLTPEDRATLSFVDFSEKPKISAVAKICRWLEGVFNASRRVSHIPDELFPLVAFKRLPFRKRL